MIAKRCWRTRPVLYLVAISVLTAWAATGLTTGHAFLQYWRAPPADFDGWAAVAFSMALLVAAMAMVLRLVQGRPPKGQWAASSCLFVTFAALCATAVACELVPRLTGVLAPVEFTGFASDMSLRRFLDAPRIAAFVARGTPFAFSWLKVTLIFLVLFVILFKVLGVTRESADRHPALSGAFSLLFGLPLLTLISLELIQYVFGTLSSTDAKPFDSFSAKTSFALSFLILIAGIWMTALLLILALVLRAAGFAVMWDDGRPLDAALEIPDTDSRR